MNVMIQAPHMDRKVNLPYQKLSVVIQKNPQML